MGFCSNLCAVFCSLIFGALLTLVYWWMLYHTQWAYGLAIFSIIFFGLSVLGHAMSAVMAMVSICATGTIALLSCPVGGPFSFLCVLLVGAIVTLILAFQFGVAIWGLVLSIHLLNSGGYTCPIGGVDCGWLVVLFFLTMVNGSLKSKRVEPTNENGEQQPMQPGVENGAYNTAHGPRVFVESFVFNPRAAAGYSYPVPTAPPPPYEA